MAGYKMSEKELQNRIIDLAEWVGCKVMHINDSRGQKANGYPDLTISGPRGVLFAELKSDKGRVREDQKEWLESLRASGQTAVVWRPGDWAQIESEIKRIAGRTR